MDKNQVKEILKNIDEDRIFAMLSYISILCMFPLLYKKDNEFVISHARQGLAMFLCEFAIFIVSIILPFLMRPFLFVFCVLAFWGMLKALRGERVELPLIYPLSNKLVL